MSKGHPMTMTDGNVRLLQQHLKWETRRLNRYFDGTTDYRTSSLVRRIGRNCEGDDCWVFHHKDFPTKPSRPEPTFVRCPLNEGDEVWIQETHRLTINDAADRIVRCDYEADGAHRLITFGERDWLTLINRTGKPGRVTPGRFMFESCARLRRRLVRVRAQFLHDVTDLDAEAEGIDRSRPLQALANVCTQFPKLNVGALTWDGPLSKECRYAHAPDPDAGKINWITPRAVYALLWEGIHGAGSWAANPIVWAYTFER